MAIKSVLKSDDIQNNDMRPQIISAVQFEQMMKEQIFLNNNSTINFKKKHYFKNQKNIVYGIAVDPILPDDFWNTAHEDREKIELDEWWERPFIVTQGYDEERAMKSFMHEWNLMLMKQKMNIMKELQSKRKVGTAIGQKE